MTTCVPSVARTVSLKTHHSCSQPSHHTGHNSVPCFAGGCRKLENVDIDVNVTHQVKLKSINRISLLGSLVHGGYHCVLYGPL